MVMNFSIDRTVDNSGLEAGVGIAKRYRGRHRNICDEVFTIAVPRIKAETILVRCNFTMKP
jgi:hypothetical protein